MDQTSSIHMTTKLPERVQQILSAGDGHSLRNSLCVALEGNSTKKAFEIAGLALLLGVLAFYEIGRPLRWDLPNGYSGWVVLQYGDPTCPALPHSGIYSVIQVSSQGNACTSSWMSRKWVYDEFEYVSANGKRTTIPSTGSGSRVWLISSSDETRKFLLFVGTHDQLQAHWGEQPQISKPHKIQLR